MMHFLLMLLLVTNEMVSLEFEKNTRGKGLYYYAIWDIKVVDLGRVEKDVVVPIETKMRWIRAGDGYVETPSLDGGHFTIDLQ